MSSLSLVVFSDGVGREFPIPSGEVSIGRAKTSTLCISDPTVSSHHAVLKRGYFEDVGSANGTLYNGKPLNKGKKVLLRAGDKLELGEVAVKVEYSRGGKQPVTARGKSTGKQTFDSLFPHSLVDGRSTVSASSLKGSVVGLYFSAHWCGPCRSFTPKLVEVYKACQKASKKFQVVFCSSDHNENEFNSYYKSMPWLAISYSKAKERKERLWKKFGVRGIPFLVLLDETGKTISLDGRSLIVKTGERGYPWKGGGGSAQTLMSDKENKKVGGGYNNRGKKKGIRGNPRGKPKDDELSASKRFGGKDLSAAEKKKAAEDKMTVEELMTSEFDDIIGHETIKQQLRQFYKKVQLDKIRQEAGKKGKKDKPLYHMIFQGPPGTGKTSLANVVSKLMVKMGLLATDKVVFVNNALDLLAQYSGQTPGKVDAKVEEARGGVLFIDEAYSVVKGSAHQQDSFGKEAIETIMKHLDPPTCVFIFAGYETEMEGFLKVNQGLSRRLPYRYTFNQYTDQELMDILKVMAKNKMEDLDDSMWNTGNNDCFPNLLGKMTKEIKLTQNAGLVSNWLSKAQLFRDDRISLADARKNPDLASLLTADDFNNCFNEIAATYVEPRDTSNDDDGDNNDQGPRIAYA